MRLAGIYITLFSSFSLVCFINCKKEYKPPGLQNNPRLLVVDGILTNTPDSTYITLTHSRNVSDSMPSPFETNATVIVEAENTTVMSLEEVRPGVYGGLLSLDSEKQY